MGEINKMIKKYLAAGGDPDYLVVVGSKNMPPNTKIMVVSKKWFEKNESGL